MHVAIVQLLVTAWLLVAAAQLGRLEGMSGKNPAGLRICKPVLLVLLIDKEID